MVTGLIGPGGIPLYFHPQNEFCQGDFDRDNDVDGKDLGDQASRGTGVDLQEFAPSYGRNDCPKTDLVQVL